MEKIKDVLYDLSDILLSLLIISLIFVVVSWKISDTMDLEFIEPIEKEPSTETQVVAGEDTPVVIAVDDSPGVTSEDPETPSDQTEANTDDAKPTPETNEPTEIKDVTIKIPAGTIGYNIAKILQNNGLIEDTQDFLSRVEERGLQSKLRSGTFTLSTGNTIDEIINKLTGQ